MIKEELENIILMAIVELDSRDRSKVVFKLDKSFKSLSISIGESDLYTFVQKFQSAIYRLIRQGYREFRLLAHSDSANKIKIISEKRSYVFGNKRTQMDIDCR